MQIYLYIYTKKSPCGPFPVLRMLRIVSCHFERPQVRLHRLLAVGKILLSGEILLVLGDLAEILCASSYCGCDGLEASAVEQLVRRRQGRTLHRSLIANVQTSAVRIGGFGLAVSTDKIRAVSVVLFLHRFRQRAFDVLNTGCILYNSHSRVAILVNASKLRFNGDYSDAPALSSDYRFTSSPR